ncbi:MAG: hypothetical protein J7513_02110 [Solirubrobacteraceae bacterium]|nr:hypothetical protein [Solirubrobacteraceae bacterium]
MPLRVTIDSNVIHAHFKPRERAHGDAVSLLDAAARGEILLTIAAQGSRLDFRPGQVADRLRELIDVKTVRVAEQVGRFGPATQLAPDLKFGSTADGFWDAWTVEVERWPTHVNAAPNREDCWHVESHVVDGADVFVTDDQPVLDMCSRLAAHGFVIQAATLAEFVESEVHAK